MTDTAVAGQDDRRTRRPRTRSPPEQFEADARAFLDAHATKRPAGDLRVGQGSDSVGLFPERTPEQEAADLEAAQAWAQAVFDAGFGWITGPPEYGGRGLRRSTSGSTPRSPPTTDPVHVRLRHRAWAWWRRPSWPTPPTR